MLFEYSGSWDELKHRIENSSLPGEWVMPSENIRRFTSIYGSLSWYPKMGIVVFNGDPSVTKKIFPMVEPVADEDAKASSQKPEPEAKEFIEAKSIGSLKASFKDSELVIALVGAVGTDLDRIVVLLRDLLVSLKYSVKELSVSNDVIHHLYSYRPEFANEYERVSLYMDLGNTARETSANNGILAFGCAAMVSAQREDKDGVRQISPRRAVIIKSLKHSEEVERLREIYPQGFYLIGAYSSPTLRLKNLMDKRKMTEEQSIELMARDESERIKHGQRVADTFHLSDFFVHVNGDDTQLQANLSRFLEIIFSNPFKTPTFPEYAMFLAFSAAVRSADLSRQVGAVICRNNDVIAAGANDCPRSGGGSYWPEQDPKSKEIVDAPSGRDYMRGEDPNVIEKEKIMNDILSSAKLKGLDQAALEDVLISSRIKDLTEFGRSVHAEMDALLACARNGVASKDATLFCTTFPCHNCAKHIIAAGIKKVVYIEPYPKSKALELHDDSIKEGIEGEETQQSDAKRFVFFEPFVGVGPRRFVDLFSLRLGSGIELKRKDDDGKTLTLDASGRYLRLQMIHKSYLQMELIASQVFNNFLEERKEGDERGNGQND